MARHRTRSLIGLLSLTVFAISCAGQSGSSDSGQSLTGPSTSSSGDVRFEGRIDAMNVAAGQLTVAGRAVTVTSSTEIRDATARRNLGDLRVGDQVEVEGQASGASVVATRIQVNVPASTGPAPTPAPPGAEVEFTGTVTSISSSTPGATLAVGGRTVHTNASTVVRRRGDAVAFSTLRVGQVVEVRGTSDSATSVLANRITIEDEAENAAEVEFSGTITSIIGSGPGATLVVGGRTVLTNASTVVRRRGDQVGFDRIRVGQRAEIKGVQQGANVLATRITLEDD